MEKVICLAGESDSIPNFEEERVDIRANNVVVYLSYAGKNEFNPDIERDVDNLRSLLRRRNVNVKDYKNKDTKNNPFEYGRKKTDAEEEIGNGEYVIVVISKKYIVSHDCMYEWHCIRSNEKGLYGRVFLLVLPDVKLKKNLEIYVNKLKKDCDELEKKSIECVNNDKLDDIEQLFLNNNGYESDLRFLRRYMKNYCQNNYEELTANDYSLIIDRIVHPNTRITTINNAIDIPIIKHEDYTKRIKNDEEVKRLFNEFSNIGPDAFKAVNLVGMSGCGKSSIAGMFVNKYYNYFFNIIYVPVSGDIRRDLIDKLRSLRIPYFYEATKISQNGIEEQFCLLVDLLRNMTCPKNKYNLLVFDIDSMAKIKEVRNVLCILQNAGFQKNWKTLVISNELVGDDRSIVQFRYNYTGIEFLKNIFFSNFDESRIHWYKDLNFEALFKTIHHLPLIVEQLANYLKDIDVKSLEEIYEILGFDKKLDYRKVGNKIIQNFLNKIVITYSRLDENAETATKLKNIIRHMILWPKEFYNTDQIYPLLKNMFDSAEDLQKHLNILEKKCIVEYRHFQQERIEYKIHGLIAKAFENQIFVTDNNGHYVNDIDYSAYFNNILECKYFDESMKKCVIMSICNKYHVLNDCFKMIKIAKLLQGDYKKKLYNMALEIYYARQHKKGIWDFDACGMKVIKKLVKNMQRIKQEPHSFYIGKYSVTQREWTTVMGSNIAYFNRYGDDLPMESVSWYDCIDFVISLNRITGLTFCLPSESQWSTAAPGGRDMHDSPCPRTMPHPVWSGRKNKNGLYNMFDNVKEWCYDMVVKGSSYSDSMDCCSLTLEPETKEPTIGFRLALSIDEECEPWWHKLKRIIKNIFN